MFKLDEYEKTPQSYTTWEDIAARNEAALKSGSFSFINDKYGRKFRQPDMLVNFKLDPVKKTELATFTNKILEQIDKPEVNILDERIGVPCDVKTQVEESRRKKEIEAQYEPKCFTVINIDPNNLVNITSAVRGTITLFATEQGEPEGIKVVNNIHEKISEDQEEQDNDEEDDFAYKIIKSDIVIFDITKSPKTLLRVWNIIRAIDKLMDGRSSGENLLETNERKTFILISSLMTWSNTPELCTDPEFKLHENYYGMRQCHESFRPHYLLENEFLKLGVKYRQWLRNLVIGTGLIYGPLEADLSPLLELSINEKPELPVFGTGQNYVPVIHVDDLIRFLNHIIHEFPENYEYVFAVEPEIITQNFIISVLCKSYGPGAQTRIVQSKNYLMYDLKDEDMFKLSANLPVEPSYQKMIDWKSQYRFIQAMPIIARRYFSIRRQFKPPCVIISGPPTQRVKNVANALNNLLGSVYLTPETMVHYCSDYLGLKDGAQRKWSSIDKSTIDFLSLPRGRGLIKTLYRTFILPRVQKNGYILEGFPETFNEAQLLEEILKIISEHDAQSFSDYNFDTNLWPDEYIVLLTNEKDIIFEINHAVDDKGAVSAEILMTLDHFRLKLGNENYSTEFFAEKNLHPKLFYIEEYKTELDCAKSIFQMIRSSKSVTERKMQNKYYLTVPNLLNLMLLKEEKNVRSKIKQNNLVPKHSNELEIELNTSWKDNDGKKNVLIKDESDSREEIDSTDNKYQQSLCEKLALNFSSADEKPHFNELSVPDKNFYQTGVFTDKVSKPLKGTEGNVSQCFIKNIKQQSLIGPSASKMSSGVSISTKKKSFDKERTSCKQKGKEFTVKNEMFPLIEWSAKTKKNLKGTVTGWCKIMPNHFKKDPDIISPTKSECGELSVSSNSHFLESSLTADPNVINNSNFDTEILDMDGGDKPINDVESFKNFFRTNPLFKNTDLKLYTNWYFFLDLGDIHTIRVFKKDNLSEEVSFKPCESKLRISKDIIMENLKRRDSKIPHVEERKNKSIIKYGEVVQKMHRCCGKNEVSEQMSPLNASFVEKDLNSFTGSNVSGVADSLDLTQSESFEELKINKTIEETDPMSKVNFLRASSGSDPFGGAQLSTDVYIPLESSSNIDPFNTRRVSEMSNSAKSILKILSAHSSVKKSLSSISRKVRFSAGDDNWTCVKTFEEKFNSWIEGHMEELKENGCLQNHDPCCNNDGLETCSIYLLKHLLQQVGSDWRNEHLNSLLDPFNRRTKLVNFKGIQALFEKYWSHFRTSPPDLTLLPSSVMVQIEKNYISDTVRVNQRKSLESLCDEQFRKNDTTCVCNERRDYDNLRGQGEVVSKQKVRDSLGARSSIDIFIDSAEKKNNSLEIPLNKQIKPNSTIYIDCKKTSSWDPADEGTRKTKICDKSFISFWNDSDCKK